VCKDRGYAIHTGPCVCCKVLHDVYVPVLSEWVVVLVFKQDHLIDDCQHISSAARVNAYVTVVHLSSMVGRIG
jgi:hypothetical protein